MQQILNQVQDKVRTNLKASAKKEDVEQWYSDGVKENMNFMEWLGYLKEETK